ncbi:hypothetical protein GCM10023323_67130 [Streptomyces thinghirensis]|uniref:Uncharacterized protein n=1 Tax=Streptomyces thinghirensis TaxID=551547 RepID=A0ABP9TC37_9ACTN
MTYPGAEAAGRRFRGGQQQGHRLAGDFCSMPWKQYEIFGRIIVLYTQSHAEDGQTALE